MKREDLPHDIATALENRMKELYPEAEIHYDLPVEVVVKVDQMFAKWRDTLKAGLCRDCEKKIPMEPWPPTNGTELVEGWSLYMTPDNKPSFLICPECENEDWEVRQVST